MPEKLCTLLGEIRAAFVRVDWKDLAEIIEALTTSAALIVGGFWAYIRFVKNRLPHPRADLKHEVHQRPLSNQRTLLHVVVEVSNTGGVLLPITHTWTKIFKVAPVSDDILDQIEAERKAKKDSNNEIDWPEIGCYEVKYPRKKAKIEPGESERFHFDFVISNSLKTISVYSYFENCMEKDLGWSRTSIFDLKKENDNGN